MPRRQKAAADFFRRRLISRSDVKARRAGPDIKKRHVEVVTRLPTERLATACWAFIVVKRTGREAAPVLVFRPLRCANTKNYQQHMHRFWHALCAVHGTLQAAPALAVKASDGDEILALPFHNPGVVRIEVTGH